MKSCENCAKAKFDKRHFNFCRETCYDYDRWLSIPDAETDRKE